MLEAYSFDSWSFSQVLVQLWFAWEELCKNNFEHLDFEDFSILVSSKGIKMDIMMIFLAGFFPHSLDITGSSITPS